MNDLHNSFISVHNGQWRFSLPVGSLTNPSGTGDDATEHHFTQKERDVESGNDYFEARYYSNAMGRFISPDWSAKEEPVPYANLEDPQSLNLYSYVRNNPLFKPDLDGHGCPPTCSDQQLEKGQAGQAPGGSANPENSQGLQKIKAEAAGTVETGKAGANLLSMSGLPGLSELSDLGSAAVSLIQGNTAEAATSLALAIPVGGFLGDGIKGAKTIEETSKVFSAEKQALVDMAKTDKKLGMSSADMQAYKDLNKTLPDPFLANKVWGPESHASGLPSSQQLHGQVGPVDHILTKDKTP